MSIARRLPVYVRPLPAAASFLAIVLGIMFGPNWNWDWALQTGNIFIVIAVPSTLITFSGLHIVFLILLVLGIAGYAVFGRVSKGTAALAANKRDRGIMAPRMRFYPVILLFGLFLVYFGTVFLFKASISGAEGGVGWAAFVYLNYDGILNRGFISLFGAAVLSAGLYLTAFMTWQPGLGFDVRPLSRVITRPADEEEKWQPADAPARPAPRPASPPARAAVRTAGPTTRSTNATATPRRAPSTSPPSSASRPARSPASPKPPVRTAARSKRPSTASSRAAAGTAPP